MTTPESSHPQPTEAMSSPSEQLVVNLQIVSPSVGVNRPLLFPDLPATMTIKRLKDKIRQTLPLRPSDENQRLIHRGRALVRESDSLLDIFGADVLRVPERQTIHLVIRDAADIQTPTLPTVARGPSPTQSGQTANVPRAAHSPHPQFGPEPPPGFPRRSHYQTTTHIAQPRVPSPAPTPLNVDQAATFQQQHQNMTNWLGQVQRDAQLQREAMVRALVNQNQRGRAQMGMRGVGDSSSHGGASGSEANNGRVSPGGSHSVHYEAFGSNGQPYHVDNVVRSATQGNMAGLSSADVQNIMRSADANQAAMAMANALQRSASGPSLHSRPLTQPGVTTPILGPAGSLAGSGRATPDQDPRPTASGHVSTTQSNSLGQPQHGPQVYLVSSPEGPRALLFNSSAMETYYTPRLRTQASFPRLRSAISQPNLAVTPPTSQHGHGAPQQDQQPQPRNEPADEPPAQPPIPPVHANNPGAAGLPPFLIQLWPHMWLILRLGLFVWFFTSPNASWSRWLTIICLAVFMFVLSTGLLNGIAENAWRPIGRHLENVLPTLEPAQAGTRTGLGRDQAAPGGSRGREGVPEQMAARLVDDRRARQGWLAAQVRRLERAGLLFLASLAPGVAERHIANLEAEVRAEESRRREAEAAAEAAAAAATSGANEEGNASGSDGNQTTSRVSEGSRSQEQGGELARDEAPLADAAHEPNREEIMAL